MADESELLTYEVNGSSVTDFFTEINSLIEAVSVSVTMLTDSFAGMTDVDPILASINDSFVALDDTTSVTRASVVDLDDVIIALQEGFTTLDDTLTSTNVKLDELTAATQAATSAAQEHAVATDEEKAANEGLGASLKETQGPLLLLGLGAVMAGKSFLDMGIQAQDSFMLVQGMAGDTALPQYMGALQQQAADLGTTMTQEAQSLYMVDSAGYDLAHGGMNVMRYALEASKASMSDAGTVAAAETSILHAYTLGAKDAGFVTDELVQTTVLGKQSFEQLASAVGPLAAVGHNVGMSLQEILAAEATMTQINPNVRMDVNELKFLFNATSLSIQAEAANAHKLKLKFDELSYSHMTLIQRLQYLAEISGGTATVAFKKMTGGVAGMQAALMLLSGHSKTYESNLLSLQHAQGATDKAFAVSEETITGHVDHIKSSLSIMASQVVTAITPAVNGAFAKIGGMFDWLGKHTEVLMPILAGLAVMLGIIIVGALGLLLASISPVLLAVLGFAAVAGAAVAIFGGTFVNAFQEMSREAEASSLKAKLATIANTESMANQSIDAIMQEKGKILQELRLMKDGAGKLALEQRLAVVDQQLQEAQGRIAAAKKEKEGVQAQLEQLDAAVRLHSLQQKDASIKNSILSKEALIRNMEQTKLGILLQLRLAHDEATRHHLLMQLEAVANAEKQAKGVIAAYQKQRQGLASQMSQAQGDIKGESSNPIVNMIHGMQQAWQTALPFLQTAGASFLKTLQEIGSFLADTFKPVWDDLVTLWQQQLLPLFKQLWGAIQPLTPLFVGLAEIVGAVVVVALGLLVGVLAGVVKGLAGLLSGVIMIFGGVVQVITGAIQVISGIIRFFIDLVTGNFSQLGSDLGVIWQGIINIFQGAWTIIAGVFVTAWKTIAGVVSGFVQGVIGFFRHLWDELVGHSIIPDMVNSIVNYFLSLPGRVLVALGSFVTLVGNKFRDFWHSVVTDASSILGGLGDVASQIWGNIEGAFKGGINTIIDGVNTLINAYNALPKLGVPNIGTIPHLDTGGIVMTGGIVDIHANERVFLPAGASVAAPGSALAHGSSTPTTNNSGITIHGDVHLHGVQNVQDLWQQLNEYGGLGYEYGGRGATVGH